MSPALLSYPCFVETLADVLLTEPECISPESVLVDDLGMQSIDVVQLVDLVELDLDVEIDALDLRHVETVHDLYWALMGEPSAGADDPHLQALRAWLPDDPLADVDTLVGMVARRAQVTPERPAVRFDGVETSYAELADQMECAARALRRIGVGVGDRVLLVVPNSAAFFALFYGIQHLRAVAVPLFHVPQAERIARISTHCGARAIVTLRPLAPPVRSRIRRALGDSAPPLLDAASLLSDPAPCGAPLPLPQPDDLAMLQYTSGTTGDAKGVMLTHTALVANVRQAIPKARFNQQDVFVSWLPVYHDMGLITMTMCPMYLGAALVLLPVRLNADAWLSAIQDHCGTVTAAPDFAYRYALRVGGDLGRYDCSSLRMGLVAAEPVRARTIARFEAALGLHGVLRPGYGLAESCVAVAFYPLDRPEIAVDGAGLVACGTPVPGTTLSIRDADGQPVPAGQPGEVCLRAPSQTLGYFRNPAATAALFTTDGFVRTGDVGYLDDHGMLTLVDRLKNILIVAGRTLSPKEIEEVADGVPGVALAMAVGVDNGGPAGEQVHLVVEALDRTLQGPEQGALMRAVRRQVRDRMDVRVARVHVVPRGTVPRTYNGKLRYGVMRARLQTTGSPLPSEVQHAASK